MPITYRLGWYKYDAETGTHSYHTGSLSHRTEAEARRAYDSLTPTDTYPQIELWEETRNADWSLEDSEKIAMKDSTGEYPWWEF